MCSLSYVGSSEEIMAKRKENKAKRKLLEVEHTLPELRRSAPSEPQTLVLKDLSGAITSSKKRNIVIEPEKDLENVIIKIPHDTTVISGPSAPQNLYEANY